MSVCVRQSISLLHNSKTMKPTVPKLCMHTKGTPRWCMNEKWVFGLIKTPHLKMWMALFNYILYQVHPRTPRSRWGLKVHSRLHLTGVLLRHFVWPAQQYLDFEQATTISFKDKALKKIFFFHFPQSYHIIECFIIIPSTCWTHHNSLNARRCQCSRLSFIYANVISSRIS